MVDEARIDAGAPAYRGFLFSDMRGFTAFGERYGNSAAAAAVSRFLDIARTAIARHQGAEIKTEGDAIHAVFPSASSAVLCGLDIVDAAAELNAEDPADHPLGLGVGVHAGEAVETAEGYIGRAVNIAARLCAVAKPGEVLVSSTVKGITQASISVGFIPRGTRRLKGIEDSIVVYAVTREQAARGRRAVPRPVAVGAGGLAAIGVLALAAFAGSRLISNPVATPMPTDAAVARPVVIGSLPIATYQSRGFQPRVTFDIAEQGWIANRDAPEMLGLVWDASPRGNVEFLRVQEVVENPCGWDGEGAQTELGLADIVTSLQGRDHLTVSEPVTVRVGGYTGREIEVTVLDSALAACGGLAGGGDVAVFVVGGDVWQASAGERFRLVVVTVGTQAVTMVVSSDWPQIRSVQELEGVLNRGQRILDSVRF
ncbi:MAG: adenylate/guanylate cyclase domain-containing protein [Chloroflexota bacterium]